MLTIIRNISTERDLRYCREAAIQNQMSSCKIRAHVNPDARLVQVIFLLDDEGKCPWPQVYSLLICQWYSAQQNRMDDFNSFAPEAEAPSSSASVTPQEQ